MGIFVFLRGTLSISLEEKNFIYGSLFGLNTFQILLLLINFYLIIKPNLCQVSIYKYVLFFNQLTSSAPINWPSHSNRTLAMAKTKTIE